MKSSFVYTLYDKVANKTYVGMHVGSVDDGYICGSKTVLAIYKERPQDFVRTIVCFGSKEYCREVEYLLTKKYMEDKATCYNKGANKLIIIPPEKMAERNRKAGEAISKVQIGRKVSDTERKRLLEISPFQKGVKIRLGAKHTEEAKQKMSEAKKGSIPWNIGMQMSEEHRNKLSLAHMGYVPPESQRIALSKGSSNHWKKVKEAGCKTLAEYKNLVSTGEYRG